MARRILTAYERVAIWREAEDQELHAPWSVKPAPGTLYRGLALRLTPELRDKIDKLLGEQDYDETFGQHLKIGPLLLQHIQNTRGGFEQPTAGMGTFWSTNRRVSEDAIAATQSFNQEPDLLPVMIEADWDGTGLDYDGMNAGPHNWPGDKEQVLKPGTALRIKNLQIGVPQAPDGRWYEVLNPPDDDPDYAGMGPGPLSHTAAARLAVFSTPDPYYFPDYDFDPDDDDPLVDLQNAWVVGQGMNLRKPHIQRGIDQGPAVPDSSLTETERHLQNMGHEFATRVHQAPPTKENLYRGMTVPSKWLETVRRDRSVTLPLGSFTFDYGQAADYSLPDYDRTFSKRLPGQGVVMRLAPGAKALHLLDGEHVSHGDFDVTDAHPMNDQEIDDFYGSYPSDVPYHPYLIDIRQRSVPPPARTRTAARQDRDCTCWEGYERVPGTEPCASKSCRKKTATKARLAMPTYYHVAPAESQKSILQHGLDHAGASSPWGDSDGNYFWEHPDDARDYAQRMTNLARDDDEEHPGYVVLPFNYNGPKRNDPEGNQPEDRGGSFYTTDPIPASAFHTAARLAMPAEDAYDTRYPREERNPYRVVPGGPWYHGSDHELPDGTELVPSGGESKWKDIYEGGWEERPKWVWFSDDPDEAKAWGEHVYEIEPTDDGPHRWNGQAYDDDYVAQRARVLRRLTPEEFDALPRRGRPSEEMTNAEAIALIDDLLGGGNGTTLRAIS